jgi:hypothetical protein
MVPQKKFLRPDEAGRLIGRSKRTVYRWYLLGYLEGHKDKGTLRLTTASVLEAAEAVKKMRSGSSLSLTFHKIERGEHENHQATG